MLVVMQRWMGGREVIDISTPRSRMKGRGALFRLDFEQMGSREHGAARRIQCMIRTHRARILIKSMCAMVYERKWDPQTGKQYWVNKQTGETKWDPPALIKADFAIDPKHPLKGLLNRKKQRMLGMAGGMPGIAGGLAGMPSSGMPGMAGGMAGGMPGMLGGMLGMAGGMAGGMPGMAGGMPGMMGGMPGGMAGMSVMPGGMPGIAGGMRGMTGMAGGMAGGMPGMPGGMPGMVGGMPVMSNGMSGMAGGMTGMSVMPGGMPGMAGGMPGMPGAMMMPMTPGVNAQGMMFAQGGQGGQQPGALPYSNQ
jgi:hypothetical protein